jgi:hypothetical protein
MRNHSRGSSYLSLDKNQGGHNPAVPRSNTGSRSEQGGLIDGIFTTEFSEVGRISVDAGGGVRVVVDLLQIVGGAREHALGRLQSIFVRGFVASRHPALD